MPTYAYACEKCGHHFELVQSINDEPLKQCPQDHCGRKRWGKGRVERQISAGAGLLFKGSGFYTTDYRSPGYHEAAKKETTPAPSATPAAPATGASQPTAKTEAKPAKPAAGSA